MIYTFCFTLFLVAIQETTLITDQISQTPNLVRKSSERMVDSEK